MRTVRVKVNFIGQIGIASIESDIASVKQKLRDKFRVICDSLGVAEVTI
jgi:hypothetical protein